jgi:hypothetical protein
MANSVAKILFKVGNDKTLSLFKTIVAAEQNTDSRALEKLKSTRKPLIQLICLMKFQRRNESRLLMI